MKRFMLMSTLLWCCIAAVWKEPIPIFRGSSYVRHYNTMIDFKGNTHVAYCIESVDNKGNIVQDLKYMKLDPTNKVLMKREFNAKRGCRVVKISTDGAEKNIVIVFEGKRQFHLGLCNSTNTDGCYDIYYTISFSAGSQWTQITNIKRHAIQDASERVNPNLVVDDKNDKVYIVYSQKPIARFTDVKYYSIGVVSKKTTSMEFSEETIVFSSNHTRIIGAGITTVGNGYDLHVILEADGVYKEYHTTTMKFWMRRNMPNNRYRYSRFVAANTADSSMLAAIYTDGSKSFVIYSTNNGETWSEKLEFSNKYHKGSTASLVPNNGKYTLSIITTDFMSKIQENYIVTLPDRTIVKTDPTFKTIANYGTFLPQILDYTTKPKGSIYRAFAYVWCNRTDPGVYVSDYGSQ